MKKFAKNEQCYIMLNNIKSNSARCVKILDIGFGKGEDLLFWHDNGFDVYGTEISEMKLITLQKKLTVAKDRFHLYNVSNCKMTLPFADDFFHIVTSFSVMHHFNYGDVSMMLREISRVIKMSGVSLLTFLSIVDNDYAACSPSLESENEHFFHGEKELVSLIELYGDILRLDHVKFFDQCQCHALWNIYWKKKIVEI